MEPPEGVDVYNEDGVDVSLIREMLAKTPTQRLEWLEDHANTILMMRHELEQS